MPTLWLALEPGDLTPEEEARVRAAAAGYDLLVTRDAERARAAAGEILIVAGFPPREVLADLPRARWFQQFYAGADWLTRRPELAAAPLVVTSGAGIHPIQIGEHVFAQLLALKRDLPAAVRAQDRHEWRRESQLTTGELYDTTLLVVGVGAIGGRVAELGRAFGMRVWGVRRDAARAHPAVERMVAQDAFEALLPEVDAVVLTVPRTRETLGMFGDAQFARLKPGAVLVNIGRGGTVDEAALGRALDDGRLSGAALDVFDTEPLPADAPLWDQTGLLITSHYAGLTPRYQERALALFLDNLRRFLRGEPLRNVVDKALGY